MELLYRYAMVVVVVVVAAGELRRHSSPATPTACRPFFQEKRTNTILIHNTPPKVPKVPKKLDRAGLLRFFCAPSHLYLSLYIYCAQQAFLVLLLSSGNMSREKYIGIIQHHASGEISIHNKIYLGGWRFNPLAFCVCVVPASFYMYTCLYRPCSFYFFKRFFDLIISNIFFGGKRAGGGGWSFRNWEIKKRPPSPITVRYYCVRIHTHTPLNFDLENTSEKLTVIVEEIRR